MKKSYWRRHQNIKFLPRRPVLCLNNTSGRCGRGGKTDVKCWTDQTDRQLDSYSSSQTIREPASEMDSRTIEQMDSDKNTKLKEREREIKKTDEQTSTAIDDHGCLGSVAVWIGFCCSVHFRIWTSAHKMTAAFKYHCCARFRRAWIISVLIAV